MTVQVATGMSGSWAVWSGRGPREQACCASVPREYMNVSYASQKASLASGGALFGTMIMKSPYEESRKIERARSQANMVMSMPPRCMCCLS